MKQALAREERDSFLSLWRWETGEYAVRWEHKSGGTSTWNPAADGDRLLESLDCLVALWIGPRCRECGNPIDHEHIEKVTRAAMLAESLCHGCLFWTNRFRGFNPETSPIVNGYCYSISPDNKPSLGSFYGHGGAEFRIRFHDGRFVVSRNLWANGKVPVHFRDRLPDNAEFEQRGHKSIAAGGYMGAGSADAVCEASQP